MRIDLRMRWAWVPIVVLVTGALASCGGGTVVAGGVGTGGTGSAYGTVTGFGSVIVDGKGYNSATPQYLAATDVSEEATVTSTTVELGAQVQIQLDAQGNPSTVRIEPELVGPVSNLQSNAGASSFMVNGMPVRVNGEPTIGPVTYYQGMSGFSGLLNGMQVEVHGVYGEDALGQGYIQATLVEQLPNTNTVTRLSGLVSNLNAAAGSFQIGGATVLFDATTNVQPAGIALGNGQWVNVWSPTAPGSGGAVNAHAIRIRTLQGVSGPVQLAGLVTRLSGSQFALSGTGVDASAPALAAVVQSLTPGEYVVVDGQSVAASGTVVASGIRAYASQPSVVELRGTITSFVGVGNFLVRGVPVDASTAAFLADSSPASLVNGAYVDIVGKVSGNVTVATSVSVLSSVPDGATVDYPGTVSAYNASNGSFVLTLGDGSSMDVTLAANVAYGNGSAGDLVNGATVEVSASKTASGLLAYSIEFLKLALPSSGSGGAGPFEASGLAYNVTPVGFMLNGLSLQITSTTSLVGVLADGVSVETTFVESGGQNVAQSISVDQ